MLKKLLGTPKTKHFGETPPLRNSGKNYGILMVNKLFQEIAEERFVPNWHENQ